MIALTPPTPVQRQKPSPEWREGLEVGDKVELDVSNSPPIIATVTHVTPQRVRIDGGYTFNKTTGKRVGDHSPWSFADIYPLTPERTAVLVRARRLRGYRGVLHNLRIKDLTDDHIEQIYEFFVTLGVVQARK